MEAHNNNHFTNILTSGYTTYVENKKIHRKYGPAIIGSSGGMSWFRNGKWIATMSPNGIIYYAN